jgi:hypothetical protein
MVRFLQRAVICAAIGSGLTLGLPAAAFAGSGGPSVGFTPDTTPDLSCPYALNGSFGHHGGSWDGTYTTQYGTLTFSVPDPQPGGSR